MAIVDAPRGASRPGPDGRDLRPLGLTSSAGARWNLSPAALYEEIVRRGEAAIADGGAVSAVTGHHTGRSPADKFVVREPSSEARIWWGSVNQELSPADFEALRQRMMAYLNGHDLYVQDLHGGADPRYRIGVRVICELAWHSLFARTLLQRPSAEELGTFMADWTIVSAPGFQAEPTRDGVHSSTVIALSFSERLVLIGGTQYAGEIKKSVFTILNYLLPLRGVMSMHC